MATLTITPTPVKVGSTVVIDGTGFTPDAKCTISILETGESFDVKVDKGGEINSVDLADKAFNTLTLAGNAVAAETVTIDGVVYTWRAAPTTVAGEVKVGVDASTSLDNLKAAINADPAGSGTLYGSLTVVHPTVIATLKTASTLVVAAKTGGTAGNSLASTETMTAGSWTAGTLASGAAATGYTEGGFTPTKAGPMTVSATDGTNTAQARVLVFTE